MGAHVKCSEMDLNVTPQTLVEAFDLQANYNSIPEYNVGLITLFTYPVSTCKAERSFSGMKGLQFPLRRTMTDERFCSLAILHVHKHKNVIDIDGIITESPFACNGPYGVTVLPFFAINSLYLTDNTRDRWVK